MKPKANIDYGESNEFSYKNKYGFGGTVCVQAEMVCASFGFKMKFFAHNGESQSKGLLVKFIYHNEIYCLM